MYTIKCMHSSIKKSSKAMIIYSYNTYILPSKDLLTNTCEKLPIRKEISLKWLIFESSEQLPRSNYMCGYHWLVIFMPTGYDCILEREYVHTVLSVCFACH